MSSPGISYDYRRPTLEIIREAHRASSAFLLFDDWNVQFEREVGEQRFPRALEIRARAALVGVCRERARLAQAFDGAQRHLPHAVSTLEEVRVMPRQLLGGGASGRGVARALSSAESSVSTRRCLRSSAGSIGLQMYALAPACSASRRSCRSAAPLQKMTGPRGSVL